MLQVRVPDGSMCRLVSKCLHVGVLDGYEFSLPVQGSVISPLLGNVYLHYVLDMWFERVVKPRMRGHVELVRYADDFVILFENGEDAQRVMSVLPQRFAKFNLTLHPDKTRLLPFRRPPKEQQTGKGASTFDLLGFTLYWRKTRTGGWKMWCKTRSARLRRALDAVYIWCRDHRHWKFSAQYRALVPRVRGHLVYYGVNGNIRSLQQFLYGVRRAWHKWLRRRGNRHPITWERFAHLLEVFPLPPARIYVKIW